MGTKTFCRALPVIVAAGLAALTLASCGRSSVRPPEAQVVNDKATGPQLSLRPANASRASEGSSRDFAFVRYSIDVSKDLPRACLIFNSTLDPQKDYKPFVAISPNAPIVLSTDGANLCVGGLTFGAPHELTCGPACRRRWPVADLRRDHRRRVR